MTEQIPNQNPNEDEKSLEQKLAEFRAEALALREKALVEPGSYDLVEGNFDPNELNEADMLIYEKFKNETLNVAELEAWKKTVVDPENLQVSFKDASQRNTRNMWASYLSNKMASRIALAELEKRRREKDL